MAERIIKVCDDCGRDLDEGTGAEVRVAYVDKRRGVRKADLCDDCASKIPGRPARARRDRRDSGPASSAPTP